MPGKGETLGGVWYSALLCFWWETVSLPEQLEGIIWGYMVLLFLSNITHFGSPCYASVQSLHYTVSILSSRLLDFLSLP